MASDMLVFDSLAHPPRERSIIRRWAEGLSRGTLGHLGAQTRAGGMALRQGAESLLIGGVLGAAHASGKTGLDTVIRGRHVPADLAGGLFALGASAWLGFDDMHHDVRNAGATGIGIFGFRKAYDYMAEKMIAKGEKPGGTFGPAQGAKVAGEIEEGIDASGMGAEEDDDPIARFAKAL